MKRIRMSVAILVIAFLILPFVGSSKAQAATATREGIDVSGWQGSVDWSKVKTESGKKFVFIRCGYRGPSDDELATDSKFVENLEGALDAGLDVGVYFATQALNAAEAREEADYTLSLVNSVLSKNSSYELTLPIVIDFEDEGGNPGHRLAKANLSVAQHNAICEAFCDRIEANGFTAGFYSSKNNLDAHFTVSQLAAKYSFWYARYLASPDKDNVSFMQYSKTGSVSGIAGDVDLNRQYMTAPSQVKNLKVRITSAGNLWTSWTKVPGVYGYQVYRTSSKTNKEELIATVKGAATTSYKDKKVENGVTYTYRIRGILKTNEKTYYGSFSSKASITYGYYKITLKTNSGTITSGNVTKYVYGNKVTLPTKIERKGYVFGGWYTNSACTKNKTTVQKATVSGNKTYYAKWTKVKVAAPTIKSLKNTSSKKMVVTWKKKISNADGYVVKYSLKSNMKSATTATVTKGSTLSTTIKNLKKGKKYYVEVYAYQKDSTGAKVLSAASKKASIKITK